MPKPNKSEHQMLIPFRTNPKEDVTDEVLLKVKTHKGALRLCIEVSGLDDKVLRQYFRTSNGREIDKGAWSRMFDDNDPLNFPTNEILKLMEKCGNLIPVRWLALKAGHELKPLKSLLEVENESLRAQLDQERREREVILKAFKEVNR